MSNTVLVVGLGSNIQPLTHLRKALKELKNLENCRVLKVARIYESDPELPNELINGRSEAWNQQYLNSAVLVEVKNFDPFRFLKELKSIEAKLGRKPPSKELRWGPREIDLDILFAEEIRFESEYLSIPHQRLLSRPFALLPLLELVSENKLDFEFPIWARTKWLLEKPFNTHVSKKYFWTEFMGILNLTEDSFSDGQSNNSLEKLRSNALKLMQAGAQILDLGAESTRPLVFGENRDVDHEKEYNVLRKALEGLNDLLAQFPSTQISIDCRHPTVLQKLLNSHKIDIINDVTGFRDSSMRSIASESRCQIIVMHSLSVPVIKDETIDPHSSPVKILNEWWTDKVDELLQSGIALDRIIFDPGIGFGKTPLQNCYLLNNLQDLNSQGCSVLIGHSRKSFLQLFTEKPAVNRDPETALVTAGLNKAYYDYLRAHDIESNKSALVIPESF